MMQQNPIGPQEFSLQECLEILRRRRWTILNTTVAILVLGCVATSLMTPIFQAKARLLVRAGAPQISAMNTENPLVDLLAMAQPETVDTQIEFLRSRPFQEQVLIDCGVPVEPDQTQPQIRVAGVRETNVIEVTVESANRELVPRVANRVLDNYLQSTRLLSLQEITGARTFVEKQERQAERRLRRAEDRLLRFRQSNRVAELATEQQNRTQLLITLEGKARETESEIRRVQAQMRDVRQQLVRQSRERLTFAGRVNPRVEVLQGQMAEAMVERASLLQSYQSGSARVRTVDAQLASLRAQLAAEPAEQRVPLHAPNERYEKLVDRLEGFQTDLKGFQAQSAQLATQLSEEQRRVQQLGPWEVRLLQLQRDRDMAEKSYLGLVSKREDLQIRENARRSTARVIEQAELPVSPVRPRKALNIVIAGILGVLLGCGLAFILECLDDRITSPEEVDRLLGLPLLGHIPTMEGGARLLPALPAHSQVAESYRGLRSSISFSAVDAPLTTLGVTSAHSSEGKSTTAVNLALAMAMDGRSVILVDADLRRPSLDRQLGLSPSPGLTDVLTGRCSLDEAVREMPHRRLSVLTSGAIPPNPAELLNTGGMESVIDQLRHKADIVIFDTPPCLPVTDAQVLGARLDGMILVLEMGEARKGDMARACALLHQARIRVLGAVLNKCARTTAPYYRRDAAYLADDKVTR